MSNYILPQETSNNYRNKMTLEESDKLPRMQTQELLDEHSDRVRDKMTLEGSDKLQRLQAQELIDDQSDRVSFLPSKNDGNSFSTLVVDDTLRDFVVCNLCSTAIPWKSQSGTTDQLKHQCLPRNSLPRVGMPDFILKSSPRSTPEKDERGDSRAYLTKQEITALIQKSSGRVRLYPGQGRSNVWKSFSLIEVDGIRQYFAYCNHCNSVIMWKSKDGTNGLRKHVCKKPPDITVSELLSETSSMDTSAKNVLENDREARSHLVTKREMQDLINSCSPRITWIPGKGKSQVWSTFSLVKVDDHMQDFAVCTECKTAIVWKSKDGTNSLRKHVCEIQMPKRMKLSELMQDSPQTSSFCDYSRGTVEEPINVYKLSKEEVQRMVDEASDRISLTPGKGKSEVWMTFSILEVDGKQMDLALCNQCNLVVTWKSKDGTNGLRKHLCKQERLLQTVGNFSKYSMKSSIPAAELEEAAAMMCGIDVRPIDIINGQGFLNFIQYVYNLGAIHGMGPDVKEFLPSEKALARRVDEVASIEKENLISELHLCSSFGVTLDLWSHYITRKNFLTISIHYMLESEESLVIRNRLLCNCETEHKNDETIRDKTMNILKEFGAYRKNVYVINDQDVITEAFMKEKRLLCSGHCINLCLRSVFDNLKYEEFPEIINLLQASRTLVSYVKNTGMQKKLEEGKDLQEEDLNRWNSSFYMLQSIMNAMPRLGELLSEINELDLLYNIDCNLLEEMVRLLKPFDEATKLLSWGRMPTLSLVIPTKMKLKRCLESKDEDSEIIKKIKWNLLQALDEKFQIDVVHCVGTVLHPKMKSFVKQYLGEETFEATKQQITCILNNINGPNTKKDVAVQNIKSEAQEEQSEFLSDVIIDMEAEENEEEEDELSFYLNSKYSNRFNDPLIYWKQNSSLFPNLFKVAKSVLAIPATSISSERYFNETGKQMEGRKHCLTDDSLNSLLFIHSSMKAMPD